MGRPDAGPTSASDGAGMVEFWDFLAHSAPAAAELCVSAAEGETLDAAFFHEDDYCQVEVLPASARGHFLAEMGRIDEFAEVHRDGAGFTDMYVRGETPVPLDSLGMTLSEWEAALGPMVPRFAQVLTGYSTRRGPGPSVAGWGFSYGQAVFAGVGQGGVVGPVWLSLNGVTVERVGVWCRLLRSLPRAAELVLADWSSGQVVSLADELAVAAYLRGEPDAEPGAAANGGM